MSEYQPLFATPDSCPWCCGTSTAPLDRMISASILMDAATLRKEHGDKLVAICLDCSSLMLINDEGTETSRVTEAEARALVYSKRFAVIDHYQKRIRQLSRERRQGLFAYIKKSYS